MRILYIGEIVGKTGVFAVKKLLPGIRAGRKIDFVVANADSATGCAGLGLQHAVYLHKLGIDCLTTGECGFFKRDIVDFISRASFIVRPANYPAPVPGRGCQVFRIGNRRVAVVQLLGQAGFQRVHLDNPFRVAGELADSIRREADAVIVDFHAAPTAEKLTMAAHLDGRVAAVIGSHARTLTADARVSAAGTAAVTDAGRTGSAMSVGGCDPDARVKDYLGGIPSWPKAGNGGLELQGCILEIGDDGGAMSLETVRVPCEEVLDDRTGNGDRH